MIRVAVRVRPSNDPPPPLDSFDKVFGQESTQDDVFEYVRPQIDHALEGYSSTILAYGQTGSGKTHTMIDGLLPRVSRYVFEQCPLAVVSLTCMEIYKESVYDLAAVSQVVRKALPVVDFKVPQLTSRVYSKAEDMIEAVKKAAKDRVTSSTSKNAVSSRSHAIFTVTVEERAKKSVIRLVDLAGSEKPSASLQETRTINQSLTHLSRILELLSKHEKPAHVPYRNSKLTSVLKDALGGNALCTMIACIHAGANSKSETTNTLHYASRAQLVKNHPVKNVNSSTFTSIDRAMTEIQMSPPPKDERLMELYEFMRAHPDDRDEHFKFLLALMGRTSEVIPIFIPPPVHSFCSEAYEITMSRLQ
jgi:hypothetical protein